jgi:hypothetical protein
MERRLGRPSRQERPLLLGLDRAGAVRLRGSERREGGESDQ